MTEIIVTVSKISPLFEHSRIVCNLSLSELFFFLAEFRCGTLQFAQVAARIRPDQDFFLFFQ